MVKNPSATPGNIGDVGSIPGFGRSPRDVAWKPTPVFLPGGSHAKRRLMGYSPWGHKESDMIEILSTHMGFIGRAGR